MKPGRSAFMIWSSASRSGSVYTEETYSGGTSGVLCPNSGMERPEKSASAIGLPPARHRSRTRRQQDTLPVDMVRGANDSCYLGTNHPSCPLRHCTKRVQAVDCLPT